VSCTVCIARTDRVSSDARGWGNGQCSGVLGAQRVYNRDTLTMIVASKRVRRDMRTLIIVNECRDLLRNTLQPAADVTGFVVHPIFIRVLCAGVRKAAKSVRASVGKPAYVYSRTMLMKVRASRTQDAWRALSMRTHGQLNELPFVADLRMRCALRCMLAPTYNVYVQFTSTTLQESESCRCRQ
jgi:hypothetical protein